MTNNEKIGIPILHLESDWSWREVFEETPKGNSTLIENQDVGWGVVTINYGGMDCPSHGYLETFDSEEDAEKEYNNTRVSLDDSVYLCRVIREKHRYWEEETG